MEARTLQQEGVWIPNPQYDESLVGTSAEQPKQIFKAKYIIHWRPEPYLPEEKQYALVREA